MASELASKLFRYSEEQAFLKWKRICIRGRQREALKELADLDMPVWKKRRLIREVIYYSGCSDFQPLTKDLGIYDYTPEVDQLSETASFDFLNASSAGSSATASSGVEDSATGTTETTSTSRTSGLVESSPAESVNEAASGPFESSVAESVNEAGQRSTASRFSGLIEPSIAESVNEATRKFTISETSGPVDSSLKESDFDTVEEWTASEQNSPEQTRRFEDSDILKLSPILSALRINRVTTKESEDEESIEDFAKNPNVRFFKCGKLHKYLSNRLTYNVIYTGEFNNEVTTLEPHEHAETNSSMMLLVPNNVNLEVQQLVLRFAEHFNRRVMECDAVEGSFDERVSHVLVDLDVSEPLQFAQCQAIGCRRYLIAADWLRDSLSAGRILPEDPFELIFCNEDTGASIAAPSRLARLSPKNLFDGFAVLMCRPFVDFNEEHMKRLLMMNGARVYEHPRQLISSPDQARVCIIVPKFYRKGQNRELLKLQSVKYKFVAVHYEWLFNSFLMYQVQPLLRYLHDTEPEEALEAGVPDEFLTED